MKMIATESGLIDLAIAANGLLAETSLETAIIISLLTDRRAEPDDLLPVNGLQTSTPLPPDRKGWAGDALSDDRIGSRLWLLVREKRTEETRKRAIFYCEEALQWLVTDGHVVGVDVEAEWNPQNTERLDVAIVVTTINGEQQSFNISLRGQTYAI